MQDITVEGVKREAEPAEKAERTKQRVVYVPSVDILERENEIMILADIPGADEKSVNVTLEKNILSFTAKADISIPERHKLMLSEYGLGDYERSFSLSSVVDRDKIRASVKNGVMKIVLPKAETARQRTIEVRAEG
jgi:HSP20 family protein